MVSLYGKFRACVRKPYLSLPELSGPVAAFSGLSVPGRLRIAASRQETGFAFVPLAIDDLPRRVQAGEAIAADAGGFPLLAPVPGIIDYDATQQTFTLKTEGAVKFGPGGGPEHLQAPLRELREIADSDRLRERFLESLREGGLPSLDYRGLALGDFFARVFEREQARVVFGFRDGEGGIDWKRLFAPRREAMRVLTDLLQRMHPDLLCLSDRPGSSGPADYGASLPEVVVRRLLAKARRNGQIPHARPLTPRRSPGAEQPRPDVEPTAGLIEQGIVFLGPATLYALLDWLCDRRPFTDRLAVVRVADRARSRLSRSGRRTQLFRLINGYDLHLLFHEKFGAPRTSDDEQGGDRGAAAAAGRLRLVAGNLFRRAPGNFPDPDWRFQNIYGPASYHILRRDPMPLRGANLPCSGCQACEQICPVDAGPLALLENNPESFRAERCLECGLCDFVCESGISLSVSIAARRRALALPERAVC